MEELVTTLEQSRKLKEWGAPQDTVWHWGISEFDDDPPDLTLWKSQEDFDGMPQERNAGIWSYSKVEIGSYKETYAAFTLQELIGWLGEDFKYFQRNAYRSVYSASGHNVIDGKNVYEGKTPLQAVFALCEAAKRKK